MPTRIRSVAVLGSGTMGSQIAAHFANAGVQVLLLDLTESLAAENLARARRMRPDPFFTADTARLIRTGSFESGVGLLMEVDWILEAVVERLPIKRALLEQVDHARRPGTIASSNTSGLPLSSLAEGRSDDFRRHWLGTHFFNPPRYLRLLEVVPTADTDPTVVDRVRAFADTALGKGVVVAKDAPNFIANRIGLFGLVQTILALEAGEFSIEEIDAITGTAIGRPKSATFRTADIVGVDVLADVARNLIARLSDDRERQAFQLPAVIEALLERRWIGEKAGQGFYRREPASTDPGNLDVLVLDPDRMAYRPRRSVHLPELDAAGAVRDTAVRIRTLLLGSGPVGAFLRRTLGATLIYSARVALAVAHSIDDVDRAMRWGFGWELGPFEMWDAIGIREAVAAIGSGEPMPSLVDNVLRAGRNRFRDGALSPSGPGLQILKAARDRQRVLRRSPGASLLDVGSGVAAIEFHSKANALGGDAVQMIEAGLKEASANFQALVIANDAPNFSLGADLTLLLIEAQSENWEEIDLMVRRFQAATQSLRTSDVPVVTCPAGLTLGGGCEIVLHSDRAQAAAESYLGLVETGVGLVPAGGGTTIMLRRAMERLPRSEPNLLPAVQRLFETIGYAKVSTSAQDAVNLGYLRRRDGTTMNRDRLAADAVAVALERVRGGYRPPAPDPGIRVGGSATLAALKLGLHLLWRAGRITEHDAVVGRALAGILSGGSLPHETIVSEQYVLDLEREAFLRLCGEPKTRDRIQHTLKTGKPLRN
jgi:3-hydroxyacyl-CoA dehydrogenase